MKDILIAPSRCTSTGGVVPNQTVELVRRCGFNLITKDSDDCVGIWLSDSPSPSPHVYLNSRPWRLTKQEVNHRHHTAFGYDVEILPETHAGLAVEKPLGHNQHGRVVRCPMTPRYDRAYQKLLTNRDGRGGKMQELRLYVYGSKMGLIVKTLDTNDVGFPLEHRDHGFMEWLPVDQFLCDADQSAVLNFCRICSVQYGVLDAIRMEGRLHVIDVTLWMGIPEERWLANVTRDQYLDDNAALFRGMIERITCHTG